MLDSERRELRRGADIVPLEPQVFDLLVFLVSNRDRVVSKDDLFASVWGGRIVSESAVSTRINAVRTAIGDTGEAQRLVRTLPRKGFRFVGEVREESVSPDKELADKSPGAATQGAVEHKSQPTGRIDRRRWIIRLSVGIAAAVVGAFVLAPLVQRTFVSNRAERFDPARVPILDSTQRAAVAAYAQLADYKALALSSKDWFASDAAPDVESARAQALQKCGLRRDSACTLYAVGMDVVWPRGMITLPPPGDLRTEPLSARFTPTGLAKLNARLLRAGEIYLAAPGHSALAVSARGSHWVGNRASADEAARLAIERCGYENQLPCLLVSLDGFWTIEIPDTRRTTNLFFPTIAPELTSEARQRILDVYRSQPWRALARGRNGTWHAVAGAASEAAAVENALQSCGKVDSECQLFAIGNFRVAND